MEYGNRLNMEIVVPAKFKAKHCFHVVANHGGSN
jgi:hypothetical protein